MRVSLTNGREKRTLWDEYQSLFEKVGAGKGKSQKVAEDSRREQVLTRAAALVDAGYQIVGFCGEQEDESYMTAVAELAPHLEDLDISGFAARQLDWAERLTKVRTLRANRLDPARLAALIAALPTVTSLVFIGQDERFTFDWLDGCPQLETLRLDNVKVDGFAALASCTRLSRLSLCSFETKDESLAFLGGLPRLSELSIYDGNTTDPEPIAALTGLRELSFQPKGGDAAAVADVAFVARLASLETLDLGQQPVKDLAPLASLVGLRELNLFGCPVSDLSPLATLKRLERLDLRETEVHDLSPLAGLPLESLNLEGLSLSAPAVRALEANASLAIRYKRRLFAPADLTLFLEGKLKLPTLKDATRTTYLIKTKAGVPTSTESGFGGLPTLLPGEPWPRCRHCQREMPLFVQLDLSSLPDSPGRGLLQLFYCNAHEPHCEVECEAWRGNDTSMLLRVIEPDTAPPPSKPRFAAPIKSKVIVGFVEKKDQPVDEDLREVCGVYEGYPKTQSGDKLWGWPAWPQGPEWQRCPICNERMEQILQLDSGKGLDHQWGDLGSAHIFLCRKHPTQLAFCWASG